MKVTWEVEDGYVGKSRPQTTEIPDEDLEGLDEAQKEKVIAEAIQEDFDSKITWEITSRE